MMKEQKMKEKREDKTDGQIGEVIVCFVELRMIIIKYISAPLATAITTLLIKMTKVPNILTHMKLSECFRIMIIPDLILKQQFLPVRQICELIVWLANYVKFLKINLNGQMNISKKYWIDKEPKLYLKDHQSPLKSVRLPLVPYDDVKYHEDIATMLM